MKSLVYLIVTGIKNGFLEIIRKPAKLILYGLLVLTIIGMFVLSIFLRSSAESFADPIWLQGILFLVIMIFVALSVQKGLSSGDAIFDMNDVNLLFVSPVSSKSILVYGLVRLLKTSFMAGFFILFQSNTLGQNFNVTPGGVLVVLGCFIFAVSLLSILSLVLYTFTNGRPRRRLAVRLGCIALYLPLVVFLLLRYIETGNLASSLEALLRSPLFAYSPIAGWASGAAVNLIFGSVGQGLWLLFIMAAFGGLMLLYILLGKADYYEDVLVASETAFEKKRALSQGQLSLNADTSRKVKVAKTGIGGAGASVFFYKHIRETLRQSRMGLLEWSSILMIGGSALIAIFLRGSVDILVFLQVLMWIQIMLIGTGKGLKELYSPYIYLIPVSSFRKIVYSNLQAVFKVLIESVLLFGITGAILGEGALLILGAIIAYALFSFLLIGLNYLSMRITDSNISAGLLVMIYYFTVILIMLPGLIPSLIVGYAIGGVLGTLAGIGILCLWELIAALLCFWFARGVLDRCDMPAIAAGGGKRS